MHATKLKNKKIGYIAFGKDDFGYGISYILNINNIQAERATVKTAKYFDVLLVSVFWWAHVYDFVRFCIAANVGWKQQKPQIIVGGFNSFNPYVFMPWAHKVIVGDGENVIMDAISDNHNDSIFTGVEKSVVYANASIGDNCYVYKNKTISRVEIARGCKYRCPYCQLTHLKPYREASLSSIKKAIDNVETKRVALFAPNGITHSNYNEIIDYAESKELTNIASDVRYNEIDKFRNNNTARMGIEGISPKLRKQVSKKISNLEFVGLIKKRMLQCVKRGYKPSLHSYFILDLPNESEEDWLEFEELLQMINKIKGVEDLTWIMTGNVFMPCPHTPYELEKINLNIDYSKKWKHALSDLWREKKFNFTIAGRHSVFSPYSRLLSMIATRGGEEASEIIYNIVKNKDLKHSFVGRWHKSLNSLSRFLGNYGGSEYYSGVPKSMPWKVVRLVK